ncbi:MAG: deoxyribodipyrimidine photo-lyase [Microscillaceae bacterium]|nr:deoxyribodipyrimidine photo-lyase [Microscillaceae bacterium]
MTVISTPPVSIFWFRRDLRLYDNAGLYQALKNTNSVLPLFIFDRDILDKLEDRADRRVEFIHHAIQELKTQLRAWDSDIRVEYGKPLEIFKKLTEEFPVAAVYTNHDYEPYALQRDKEVSEFLHAQSIPFHSYKDQCIFEKKEVLSGQNTVYTVFTPYSRKWKDKLNDFYIKSYPTEKYFANLLKKGHSALSLELISLEAMNFKALGEPFPDKELRDEIIQNYAEKRNFPAIQGTTRLSVHLRFGTVSIRKLVQKALPLNENWLNELIWRDFYMMILSQFPHVADRSFKPDYDRIPWRNDPEGFAAWCQGRTGYPIVDAGMRELNATGFMHNRVRMITASFLTKHLLIDWRWGEAYFAKKLLDFDLSANNGGWQWAASSGCDAAPYFRIFNPTAQTEKFDPKLQYIKHWIPELNQFSYPKPIVEHKFARERALKTYKEALNNG